MIRVIALPLACLVAFLGLTMIAGLAGLLLPVVSIIVAAAILLAFLILLLAGVYLVLDWLLTWAFD